MNEFDKAFFNLRELGDCVIDLVIADTTKKVFEKENNDFYRGAMWGMTWALSDIFSKCQGIILRRNKMKPVFKCDYFEFVGTEDEVRAHEAQCFENYNKKSCFTCKHKTHKDLFNFNCEVGKEIPKGKYFEQCSQYERKDEPDWSGKMNDIFRSMFGGV